MLIRLIQNIALEREMPANLKEVDKPVFEPVLRADVKDITVQKITNANVLYDGTIFRGLRVVKDTLLSNDEGEVVPYPPLALLRVLFSWPKKKFGTASTYLVIHNNYSHTYYHWLLEALPRLFLVRDKIARDAVLLLPDNHNQKFHRESLNLFDVVNVESLQRRIRFVVPSLVTASQIGTIANYNPMILREMCAYLKTRISTLINLGDKIYISRSKAVKRRVVNEDELEGFLHEAGFHTIEMEAFSFVEQISIMHHCRFLVGIHGAGMANMIFMQERGRVFELRKDDRGANYFYFSLASAAGHRYYYQFCDATDDTASVQDADIRVDIDLFSNNIKKMLSAE